MAKYRKKPVEVEAFQLSLETIRDLDYPEWFVEVAANCIVKGVKGELYPCKPDIFETTYEEC